MSIQVFSFKCILVGIQNEAFIFSNADTILQCFTIKIHCWFGIKVERINLLSDVCMSYVKKYRSGWIRVLSVFYINM